MTERCWQAPSRRYDTGFWGRPFAKEGIAARVSCGLAITIMQRTKALFLFALAVVVLGVTGCHRSTEDFDDRTLEKRPHIETVAPEDRKDPFRP